MSISRTFVDTFSMTMDWGLEAKGKAAFFCASSKSLLLASRKQSELDTFVAE
jgi:hypothetical protein